MERFYFKIIRKENMKNEFDWSYLALFLIIGLVIGFVIVIIPFQKANTENSVYKEILYQQSKASDVSIISQKADSYYNEAGFSYENLDYKSVESNCRLARDYYSDASQGYKDIKSELNSFKRQDNLIEIYSELIDYNSKIELNMFEACEHFESAVRYYDIYYNTDVPYDDMSYDMGTGEIGSMNEKIRLHDRNVEKFNDLLSDFKIEIKKRIK